MSEKKPGMTVDSAQHILGSDDIEAAQKNQEKQRIEAAYKKGKERHDSIVNDPSSSTGYVEDGYESMSKAEQTAYRKGYGGG